MRVHDSTAVEVGLEKVHHTQFGACCKVHQCLLVLDLCIRPVVALFQPPRPVILLVQLLESLLAESIQLFVVFQRRDKCILVRLVLARGPIDERSNLWV